MSIGATDKSLAELTLGQGMLLEELVDREALDEIARSAYELFRVPIRIFNAEGKLVADAAEPIALYAYLNTLKSARLALQDIAGIVKSLDPGGDGGIVHPCVTGALYRIVAIEHDGRRIGRMVLGPFVPDNMQTPPRSLLELDPEIEIERVIRLFAEAPHASEERVVLIGRHLSKMLDLILFSGYRALLTSNMHLASVRESFRELESKNDKLQAAYDRLRELDRLKSNFLATVSHELRTPLTSIIGYSEMLVENLAGDLTDEQREFVQTIRDKGEQLLLLIKSLLDLGKLESGTMSLRKSHVDIAGLVRDVVATMAPTARKKDVDLGYEVEASLPQLWADAERLRQVLLNLTENAIKFTPARGRVAISVRLGAMDAARPDDAGGIVILSARRSAIEFRVSDTGIGIPASERERVFDAFYQVDSSSTREQGGTGLGLSIVKRLVDAHDGLVRVLDNEPRGTAFVVTIPVKRATLG